MSLAERAYRIRRNALRMGEVQGQGYIAQALGVADVLAVAYFHALRYRPGRPALGGARPLPALDRPLCDRALRGPDRGRDRARGGAETYGSDDSRLPMSGMAAYTPGMEITGGSLGQGCGIAVGMCLGLKRKRPNAFVYNLLSDGELDEGATWEAAMSAAHWQLDNLICIVDVNKPCRPTGAAGRCSASSPWSPKWEAFGWHAQRVDGNDLDALVRPSMRRASSGCAGAAGDHLRHQDGQGRAVPGGPRESHFLRVEPHEWDQALAALEAGRQP